MLNLNLGSFRTRKSTSSSIYGRKKQRNFTFEQPTGAAADTSGQSSVKRCKMGIKVDAHSKNGCQENLTPRKNQNCHS